MLTERMIESFFSMLAQKAINTGQPLASAAQLLMKNYLRYLLDLKENTMASDASLSILLGQIKVFQDQPNFLSSDLDEMIGDINQGGTRHQELLLDEESTLSDRLWRISQGEQLIPVPQKLPPSIRTGANFEERHSLLAGQGNFTSSDTDDSPLKRAVNILKRKNLSATSSPGMLRLIKSMPDECWIDQILKEALQDENWLWISEIIAATGTCKLNQAAVEKVLSKAKSCRQWLLIQNIVQMRGENKLSQETVRNMLMDSVSFPEKAALAVVSEVLNMTEENRLNKKQVDECLKWLIICGNLVPVPIFLKMRGDNKPSQDGINEALLGAIILAKPSPIEMVKEILEMTDNNKPSRAGVERAMMRALNQEDSRIVEVFFKMTGDNKPSQIALELCNAFRDKNWPLVQEMLTRMGDDALTQEMVDDALSVACRQKQWLIAQDIIRMTRNNKPSQDRVGTELHTLVNEKQWAFVQEILDMTGDNKPIDYVDDALKEAARDKQWMLVQTILNMTGDNKPSPHTVKTVRQLIAAEQALVHGTLTTMLDDDNSASATGNDASYAPATNSEETECLEKFFITHDRLYKSDKDGFFGSWKKTRLSGTENLSTAIKHAVKSNNRSRKAFIELGWMNEKGNLTETVPQAMRDPYLAQQSKEEKTSRTKKPL